MMNKDFTNEIIVFIVSCMVIFFGKKAIDKNKDEKKAEPENDKGGVDRFFNKADAEKALLNIKKIHGTETARILERILRHETAHFSSGQYKKTGSAGMEVGKWSFLPPNMRTVKLTENGTGRTKEFIVWDSVEQFLEYLVGYINRHKGNWARWYSTNEENQKQYTQRVNSVTNKTII